MDIDGPTFVPKSGLFWLIWVNVCLKKLAFFLTFEQMVLPGLLEKIWALSSKKSNFVLVSGFLAFVFSQIFRERFLFHQKDTLHFHNHYI